MVALAALVLLFVSIPAVRISQGRQSKKVPVREGVTEVVVQLPQPKAAANGQKAISGRVLDPNGQGIAGADVGLLVAEDVNNSANEHGSFAGTTKTDALGNYRLPLDEGLLRDRRWGTLWAHATGFGPVRLRSTGSLVHFASKPAVVLKLEPAEGMRVKLVDERDQPVAGARVRVVRVKVKESIGWLIPVDWSERFEATTGDNGLAEIPSFLPASLNRLRIDSELAGRVEYDQNYFLNVRPEETAPHFEFLVPDAGSVEGVLQAGADAPQGLTVTLQTRANVPKWPSGCVWGIAEVISDGEGKFQVPKLAAGLLTARLDLPPDRPWRAQVPTRLKVEAGDTRQLEIPLERGVRVRGLIRKQDTGEGYPGFRLAVIYGPSAVIHDDMDHRVEVETDDDGYFAAYVPPGPIELRLNSAPRDYHHMEWWGGRSQGGIWGSRREVPDDVTEFELPPIDLAPTEHIEGTLVDQEGKPLSDWVVFGYPGKDMMNSFAGVHTDAEGRFSGYVPQPYPPRIWKAYHRVNRQSFEPKTERYALEIISEDPLVLEVGEPIEN
ncbi:MAG: carboxypeptidase regulatory-like domain-containing protein [Planctomycetota bacterium]|nr:MAG: carboxypeptidase regulatory-like domain-containing protein [Planctomycetota bacterium]